MSGIIPKMLGLHEDIIKRGTLFYVRVLIPMVFFLLAMFTIGFLFNIAGYKGANLIFSLILTLLMVLLAARPEAVINIFLAGAISGAIQPGHTMSGEVEKFFRWYTGLVTQVMLWTSIIFLFLGTVSAKGRFNALVGIIATVVLLQLIQAVWKIGRSWGKPFVYLWAVVYLGYFVLQGTGYLPQAEYYVNRWTSGIEIISGGEAARIKKLEDIRNQQRAEMVDRAYEKAEKWQIANPGRDLPEELNQEIEAAKKGLTLKEFKVQAEKTGRLYQIQKNWSLPAGTAVYENPGNGSFVLKPDLKYAEAVKVISLGESAEVNGAIYEKCGLPDPKTGQPGAFVGWIFSDDLKENSPETQPQPPTDTSKNKENENENFAIYSPDGTIQEEENRQRATSERVDSKQIIINTLRNDVLNYYEKNNGRYHAEDVTQIEVEDLGRLIYRVKAKFKIAKEYGGNSLPEYDQKIFYAEDIGNNVNSFFDVYKMEDFSF
jgi:hypothetical protein